MAVPPTVTVVPLARLVRSAAPPIVLVASIVVALSLSCGDDEPRAPASGSSGSPPPAADAGVDGRVSSDAASSTDAAIVYGDPLEGTTKTATLVKDGFSFTEGPVWIGGRLLFSDIPRNVIVELLDDGGSTTFRADSGAANGNAVDSQGRLVTCEGGRQRITRGPATTGAAPSVVVSTYASKAFNAPNDLIVRADANIYFTDPKYGGGALSQDDEAVYRIDPAGVVTRLAHDFAKPNGIALSPDGTVLYVVDNGAGKLLRASLDPAGALAGGFTDLASTGGDGMAVDDAGNLYVATSGGVLVLDKAGKELGTVTVPEVPANCTFGGRARRTLYITARTSLYSIELNVPGLP